jgi:hypothetical protein
MADHYDIDEIRARVQITDLFERDGHVLRRMGSSLACRCPFHEEKSPSCHVKEQQNSFHCYGCGEGGSIFDYWILSRGVDFKASLPDLAAIAGIGARDYEPTAASPKSLRKSFQPKETLPDPLAGKPLQDWLNANESLVNNPEEQARITKWRGYSDTLIPWAAERGLIGLYTYYKTEREAFLVEMPTPSLTAKKAEEDLKQTLVSVSCHIRLSPNTKGNEHPKQSWRFSPSGCGGWPFIVGDQTTAKYLFILEGQWDALALIDVMKWHTLEKWPASTAVIGLRGATSGDKLLTHYQLREDAIAFGFADADAAGSTWFFQPCRLCPHHPKDSPNKLTVCTADKCTDRKPAFLESLENKVSRVHGLQPSIEGADFNDLVKDGHLTRDDLIHYIKSKLPTRSHKPTGPTFLQWCKKNKKKNHPADIKTGIAHVISDKGRPPGRKPLKAWLYHWSQLDITDATMTALQTTWNAWKNVNSPPH